MEDDLRDQRPPLPQEVEAPWRRHENGFAEPSLRQEDIEATRDIDQLSILAMSVLDLRVREAKFLAEKIDQATVDLLVVWAENYQASGRDMEPVKEKRRV